MSALKKRTIRFYRMFFAYILILLILMAIVCPTIMNAYLQSVRKTIEENISTQLNNTAHLMNQRFDELNKLTNRIRSNQRLRNSTVNSGVLAQRDALLELKNYLYTNSFISDIVIYSFGDDPSKDFILTEIGKYTLSSFFKIYAFTDWSNEMLDAYRTQPIELNLYPVQRVVSADKAAGEYEYLFLFYNLSLSKSYTEGLLSFWIPVKNLQSVAQVSLGNQKGEFRLLYNDISCYCFNNYTQQDLSDSQNAYEYVAEFESRQWKYVISIPQSQMIAQLSTSRNFVILIIILLLIIGAVLSFLLADFQYRAIHRVASKLNNDGNTDEIKVLLDGVENMLQKNQELSEQLTYQSRLLRADRITAMLLGIEENSDKISLKLEGFCGIVLIAIDDVDSWKKNKSILERNLICTGICEVMEEIAQEYGNGYAVPMPDGSSCAILMDVSETSDIEKAGNEIFQQYNKLYRFPATVGISEAAGDLTSAHIHYLEASAAIQKRHTLGSNRVIVYSQIHNASNSILCYTAEMERTLSACILRACSDEASTTIRDVLNKQLESGASTEEMMLLVISLLNSLLRMRKDTDVTVTLQQKQIIRMLQSGQTVNFDQTVEYLCNLAETLCESNMNSRIDNRNLRVNQILEMIKERYCNPTFCLNEVAEALNLSPSYTTVLFKEATGSTLMSYVDDLRMRSAVTLLETTRLPLRDIVAQIGYTDQTNFIRKFKAIHGFTPAAYRKKQQNAFE